MKQVLLINYPPLRGKFIVWEWSEKGVINGHVWSPRPAQGARRVPGTIEMFIEERRTLLLEPNDCASQNPREMRSRNLGSRVPVFSLAIPLVGCVSAIAGRFPAIQLVKL